MVSSLSIELNLADTDLPADSEIGMKLISKARKVEQNDDGGMTWLSGYSIKFLGCHHIQQVRPHEGNSEPSCLSSRLRLLTVQTNRLY
jgi:hypothetical protein